MSYNSFSDRSGDTARLPRRRTGSLARGITVSVVVVLLLLIGIAGVAEWQTRVAAKNSIAEQVGVSPDDLTVSFGASPVIAAAITDNLPHVHLEIPSTLNYSGEGSSAQVTGTPELTATVSNLNIADENNPIAGTLEAQLSIPDRLLTVQTTASQESGFLQVTEIDSNPATGALDVSVNGGLGTLALTPEITADGSLTLVASSLKILGFELPESIVSSLTSALQEELPLADGIRVDRLDVVDDGVVVVVTGENVALNNI